MQGLIQSLSPCPWDGSGAQSFCKLGTRVSGGSWSINEHILALIKKYLERNSVFSWYLTPWESTATLFNTAFFWL